MKTTINKILEHLVHATAPVYGTDLVAAGIVPRSAPLYVLMGHLEDADLITGAEDPTTKRRCYRITGRGRASLVVLPTAQVVTEEQRSWRRFTGACMECGRVREIPDDAPIEPWWCSKCENRRA